MLFNISQFDKALRILQKLVQDNQQGAKKIVKNEIYSKQDRKKAKELFQIYYRIRNKKIDVISINRQIQQILNKYQNGVTINNGNVIGKLDEVIGNYVMQINELREGNRKWKQRNIQLQEENERLWQQIKELNQKIAMETQSLQPDERLRKLQKELNEIKGKTSVIENENERLRQQNKILNIVKQNIQKQNKRLNAINLNLQEQNVKLRQQIKELNEPKKNKN